MMKKIPKHIGIIMDGNGRWAIKKGEERLFGHANGKDAVEKSINACLKKGIKYLTLYAFSKENNKRDKKEVDGLINLLINSMNEFLENPVGNGVRLKCIGDIEKLPEEVSEKIERCEIITKNNDTLILTLAINYSARDEITRAFKKLIQNKKINKEDINEELISNYLDTKDYPDPDLIIRTGGELRLSNFLLWQASYSELYFTDILWPDFNEQDLYDALEEYARRDRRFGKEKSV